MKLQRFRINLNLLERSVLSAFESSIQSTIQLFVLLLFLFVMLSYPACRTNVMESKS